MSRREDLPCLSKQAGSSDNLEVERDASTLTIRTRSNVDIDPSQSIVFHIRAAGLETAEMSGVGSVTMNGWNTPDIAITLSGTVDRDVTELRATSLDVEFSGVRKLQLPGSVDDQSVVVSGTGSHMAADLASKYAGVTPSASRGRDATG